MILKNDADFEQTLETLVRCDLDRRADAVDPRPMFERIQQSHGASDHATARQRVLRLPMARRVTRWACGVAATAAAVVLAFVFGSHVSPVRASAEDLVRQAQKVQQIPVDRCYLVEVRRESELLDEAYPMAGQSRITRLWTRGDRFWIDSLYTQRPGGWGRDDRGDVWIALGSHHGVSYEPDEIPSWMRFSVDIYSMQLDTLLGEVLRDFNLTREPSSEDAPAADIVVRASLKPGHANQGLRGARLEFDGETKVIRKLVLERTRLNQPVATVTYTLIDTQPRADRLFELEDHLEEPFEILTRNEPQRRRDLVMRTIGLSAGAHAATQRTPQSRPAE